MVSVELLPADSRTCPQMLTRGLLQIPEGYWADFGLKLGEIRLMITGIHEFVESMHRCLNETSQWQWPSSPGLSSCSTELQLAVALALAVAPLSSWWC